ncbi:MAG: ribosome maturation factor RimM [Lachnospiraceae bacterium]|nr:ribosome maturation factor RimM [Lachnospiraceae bacterium]
MKTKAELLSVGQITSTHGLKGEIKVYPTTNDPEERFRELKNVILKTPREEIPVTVESVRFMKNLALLKFKELSGINEVEKYKGAYICVPRSEAAKLGPDEYYEADLIGMEIITDEDEQIGTLITVYHTGANDVYEIELDPSFRPEYKKPKEQSKPKKRTIMIPAIKDCIKNVDTDNGVMTIHLMEGLI